MNDSQDKNALSMYIRIKSVGKEYQDEELGMTIRIKKKTLDMNKRIKSVGHDYQDKYQPSGAGGTHSPPATPHRLPVGPKMADGVWKGVYP